MKEKKKIIASFVVLVVIVCVAIVGITILGKKQENKMVQKLKVDGNTYIFNEMDGVSKNVQIPVGLKVEWDIQQVINYFGKDVQLKELPKGMNPLSSNNLQHVYVDEGGYIICDNITYYYQKEGKGKRDPSTITIIVSKGKLPVMDVGDKFRQNEMTKVNGVSFQFGYTEKGECVATFLVDEVGYNIKGQNVKQKDFIDIVNSIIK